jgi:flagellar biosynthesis/type III secretory pathway chaperone
VKENFKELSKLLELQFTEQQKLVVLLREEKEALLKLNQEKLDELQNKKTTILETLSSLREKQQALLELAKFPKKLPEIIASCSDPILKKSLVTIHKKLLPIVEEVQNLHKMNDSLVKQANGIISSTISIIRGAVGTELSSYGKDGTSNTTGDPAFIPTRVNVRTAV